MKQSKGTVFKNKYETWTAQIVTPSGRRSRNFSTQRKAISWLAKMRRDIDMGEYVEPSQMTLDAWWNRWIEIYKQPNVSKATLETYKYSKMRIKPLLTKSLSDISKSDIQETLNNIQGSRRTVEMTKTALQMCFDRAVEERLLLHNPVRGAQLPVGRKKREAKALSLKDDENLLALLVRPCRTIHGRMDINDMKSQTIRDALFFIRMTGCRRSEAINLKWADIAEQIHIRGTKTEDSDRNIPIVNPVQSMLNRRRLTRNSEYVFATSNGTRLDGSNLLRWMRDNTNYTVHDLRHTYITRGAQAGVNPKVLQTLTGHKRIETLLNIYTHVSDQDRMDAAQKISICIASAIPSKKSSS